MSFNQPRKIYRYQRFSAITVEALCHDKLHFADPNSFNDPLDCQPTVESDSDRDTLRLLLTELIRRRVMAEALASLMNVKLKGNKASEHAKRLGEQTAHSKLSEIAYYATNPEYESSEEAECWFLTRDIQSELLKQYDRGVCCFSATFRNPLLWSHYGDQHRGLCIGYGLDRNPKPKLQKVEYGGSRTVATSLIALALLKNNLKAQELLDRGVLLKKAPPWRYEREWRLFGNRGVQDSALTLKDVTFGLRCPVALMHAVISAIESSGREIDFYEMYKTRGSFKLKRRSVDTDSIRAFLPHTAQSGVEIFGPFSED